MEPPPGDWEPLSGEQHTRNGPRFRGYWSAEHRCDVFRHLGRIAVGRWEADSLLYFDTLEDAFAAVLAPQS